MKPQFALNLSFDGISLLLRGEDGWLVVDETNIDSPHLERDLANLIARAGDFSAAPVKTKLIIPNEQIKYLDIPIVEGANNADLIKSNLKDATPYSLEELAFDWCEAGQNLQVAAVARETLDEAFEFASMHNFKPQGFVAIPPEGAFQGDVVFGPTSTADENIILRDEAPITVLGSAEDYNLKPETKDTPPAVMPPLLGQKERGIKVATTVDEDANPTSNVAQSAPVADVSESFPAQKSTMVEGGISFFSRRIEALRKPETKNKVIAAPAPRTPSANVNSEEEKLTLFGARDRSGSRIALFSLLRAGAIAALFIAICAFAIWFILDSENEIALLPEEQIAPIETVPEEVPPAEQTTASPAPPIDPQELTPEEEAELNADEVELALEETPEEAPQTAEQSVEPEITTPEYVELSEEELAARYAATGIWPIAPKEIASSKQVPLDDFQVASIEPTLESQDAVSLADPATFLGDKSLPRMTPPAPFGTILNLGENGLVIATPEGTLSPDGHMVYLGRPRTTPPSMPEREAIQEPARTSQSGRLLSEIRPKARPFEDVIETEEPDAAPAIAAISTRRPQKRPQSVEATVANLTVALVDETVSGSPAPRPKTRPSNLDTTVKPQQTQVASAAAPRRVDTSAAPRIPTRSNVAARATDRNALRINRVALIGVIGTSKNKRAIVIFENGRRRTVSVGDRLDGGRVAAIGDGQLKYTKGNRTITLKMPRG